MATRRVELNNDPGEQDQDPTPEPVTPVTPLHRRLKNL